MRPHRFYHGARGWLLVEMFRQDELEAERWPVMTYVSATLTGVSRGPQNDPWLDFVSEGRKGKEGKNCF